MRVLTPEQIEKMRTVCRLGREILDIGAAAIRPGVTTEEIDRIVHEATIARNAYPSPLNYNGFPKSCCTYVPRPNGGAITRRSSRAQAPRRLAARPLGRSTR